MAIQSIINNPIKVMENQRIADVNKSLGDSKVNFSDLLMNAIDNVNVAQRESEILGDQFMLGEIDNIHDVKIAGVKADLTLSLATEVTSKLLGAYNEIMRLQL